MSGDGDVLRIDHLQAAYGPRPALDAVTCAVADRRVTAVVGPSGCGKSTLLKALNRTLELTPTASVRGRVLFRGEDVYGRASDPQIVRKKIGLIHQRPVPFPMSILENVLFGLRFHGHWEDRAPDQAAREHLEQAGLWDEVKDRLQEPAASLSGGQQQRLCIARTLANRPEVILMDEPCSSLDPKSAKTIEELIATLRAKLAVVVVTHNLAQARRIAQNALVLVDGQLVESGEAGRVLTEPSDPRACAFVHGTLG